MIEEDRWLRAHAPKDDNEQPIIYFAAAIRGSDGFRAQNGRYQTIIDALREAGYEVLTGVGVEDDLSDDEIYQRDLDWLIDSNALIADVTEPSHGVGFEIATALMWGCRVLCLAKRDVRVSAMLTGNPEIVVRFYDTTQQALNLVREFCQQ